MSKSSNSHDLNTFTGRFFYFVEVCSPFSLIYTDKQVLEAQNIVNQSIINNVICGSSDDMLHYQKLVNAAIHPVTHELIPKPFRVAAIAPVNIPIVFAMITCPPTNVPMTLFLHWINQSYNTACNYYNRSGSNQPIYQTISAYILAVSSACGFAYGLGKFVNSSKAPRFLKSATVLIPCLATAAANCSNLGFTRADEVVNGTIVKDVHGKEYGLSQLAGIQCVVQTALTRCVLVPCSCLLLPPIIMASLKRVNLIPRSSSGIMFSELIIIYVSLQMALPAALAVFPQTAEIPVNKLEKRFHNLIDSNGKQIDFLYCNKGL